MTGPFLARWTGTGFDIHPRFQRACDKEFVIGQEYALTRTHDRSMTSHRHYFAMVREAWMNLPEAMAAQFPSPEHLRKWALVQAGFFDERVIVCKSKRECIRTLAVVKAFDEYAVGVIEDKVLRVAIPKSQSPAAMDRSEFQASKEQVLAILASMIGVTPDQLKEHSQNAAA